MAVAAVDTHACDVVLVAEVNGLVYWYVDHINEVYAIDIEHNTQNAGHNKEAGKYASFRSPVGTTREYLSHIYYVQLYFYEGRGLGDLSGREVA